jgi:single-strand DNA-binding protein
VPFAFGKGREIKEQAMAENIITVVGNAATEPEYGVSENGKEHASFRLASNRRRLNGQTGEWEDAGTNWFKVTAFNRLAVNAKASVASGDPVVVTGRLRINEWQRNDGSRSTTVEILADAIGHDLGKGTAKYSRPARPATATLVPDDPTGSDATGSGDDLWPATDDDGASADAENAQPSTEEQAAAADGLLGSGEYAAPVGV